MSEVHVPFNKRLQEITRRHDRMRNGVYHKMNRDGLIVAHPRRRAPRFPLKGLLLLLAAGFVFKAFLLINLGTATYDERVAELRAGTLIEQGGAWLMQADPATIWLATQINAMRQSLG